MDTGKSGTGRAHLDRVDRIHDRMLLYEVSDPDTAYSGSCARRTTNRHDFYGTTRRTSRGRLQVSELGSRTYSDAGKGACRHVLEQREVWRKRFIAARTESAPARESGRRGRGRGRRRGRLDELIIFDGVGTWLGHGGHSFSSFAVRPRRESRQID